MIAAWAARHDLSRDELFQWLEEVVLLNPQNIPPPPREARFRGCAQVLTPTQTKPLERTRAAFFMPHSPGDVLKRRYGPVLKNHGAGPP